MSEPWKWPCGCHGYVSDDDGWPIRFYCEKEHFRPTRYTVTITKELDPQFFPHEDLKDLTDEAIVELLLEDIIGFVLEGAKFKIERLPL